METFDRFKLFLIIGSIVPARADFFRRLFAVQAGFGGIRGGEGKWVLA